MSELKSCPFCGREPRTGKADYVEEHNSWLPEFVECPKCKIGFYLKEGAIKRWNTRTADREQLLKEVVEVIENAHIGENPKGMMAFGAQEAINAVKHMGEK